MYAKIFASLYQGTMRGRPHSILVFTNLLAHADRDGCVDKHWRAIAEEVGLTIEEVKAAILHLESPDDESRTQSEQGRRLIPIDEHRAWGWRIVNHAKYAAIRSDEDRREQNRMSQEARRKRLKACHADSQQASATVSNGQNASAESAHADTDADANTDTKTLAPSPPPSLTREIAEPRKTPGGDGGAKARVKFNNTKAAEAIQEGTNILDVVAALGGNTKGERATEWIRDTLGLQFGVVAAIMLEAIAEKSPIREPSGFRKWREKFEGWPEASRKGCLRDAMNELGIKAQVAV